MYKPTLYTAAAVVAALALARTYAAARHEPVALMDEPTIEQVQSVRVGMTPQQLAALMGAEPTEICIHGWHEYRIWQWTGNALQARFKDDKLTTGFTQSLLLSQIPLPVEE